MIYLIVGVIIFLIIRWYFYRVKYDTLIGFTGGLGSGKSFESVKLSRQLLFKNRLKVKFENFKIKIYNLFHKDDKKSFKENPLLYSSIPLLVKKSMFKIFCKHYNAVKLSKIFFMQNKDFTDKYNLSSKDIIAVELLEYEKAEYKKYIKQYFEFAVDLTEDYLLLRNRLNYKSVTFIDEVGSFASQYEYNNPNVRNAFDEFVRLYRHYTKGGYLIVNDQCSENIVLTIRRRINTVFNLMHFTKWFGLCYTVKIRNINISEEIKTIEENNAEDNMRTKFGFMPLFTKYYDTYCYSERYSSVPNTTFKTYVKLKKNSLLKVSKSEKKPMTTNND